MAPRTPIASTSETAIRPPSAAIAPGNRRRWRSAAAPIASGAATRSASDAGDLPAGPAACELERERVPALTVVHDGDHLCTAATDRVALQQLKPRRTPTLGGGHSRSFCLEASAQH